jgi:uncharacterized protein (TIGR02266 family)
MSVSIPANRRVYVRIPVTLSAEVVDETIGGTIYFVTRDLGVGGLFLRSDLLFDVGMPLTLRVALPTQSTPLVMRARVVWIHDDVDDENAGMGVAFEALDDTVRRALAAFVADVSGRTTYD